MVREMMSPDYQKFRLAADGSFAEVGQRMAQKIAALPSIDYSGKAVLDVGCDYGFWSFRAAQLGARSIVGVDRNREVGGQRVNVVALNREVAESTPALGACRFIEMDLGRQWLEPGRFDVVLMMSMYHHAYESSGGDHVPIWFWLSRVTVPGALVVWENPMGLFDPVASKRIAANRSGYNRGAILAAAGRWFDGSYHGPAIHSPTREVWIFRRKVTTLVTQKARVVSGGGGSSKAFKHANARRVDELERILGAGMFAGSLNLRFEGHGVRSGGYYRAQILEPVNGVIEGPWRPMWTRFHPCLVDGHGGWAVQFEPKRAHPGLTEVVAPERLRDFVGEEVSLSW